MQGEDFSWQKPQTFILSVGNNSQGHSYTRWLWKGLADYRMHVKESTWANLNGTQWLQSLQSLKPSSKCSWSVWHSHRVWNYAFNSLSLAFGKNSPSRCMWSRSAPPQAAQGLWGRAWGSCDKGKCDPWVGKTGISNREESSADVVLGSYWKTFGLQLHICCPSSSRQMS